MSENKTNGQEPGYTYDSFTGGNAKRKTESHFLWWCSGAYQDLLKECPSEQTKYAGLGGVILATFVLASLSSGYAIFSVFDNVLWAVCFALIWGAVIFNFDRFLVATMRKYGVSGSKQIWMAMPRLVLALLIGVTIARPLELKIFEKEIDVQITENRHKKILLNDSLLQAEGQTVLVTAQGEKNRLIHRKSALEDTLHRLQQAYVEEADGTGGSLHRGVDKLTRLKQQAFQDALHQYSPELHQLEGLIRYQDSLLNGVHAGIETKNRQYESQVKNDIGFLEKNKALSDLSERETSVFWANLLISLLIILIETGPVLSKLIMSTGPYDLSLARFELLQMAAAEDEMHRDKELIYEKKKDIYSQKKSISTELIRKLENLQKKHIQEELDQWETGRKVTPSRESVENLVRRIKDLYDYREEDIL
ncbi:DUF4407 domain-containing protein [Flavitalea flava]